VDNQRTRVTSSIVRFRVLTASVLLLAITGCAKEASQSAAIATTGDITIVSPQPGAVFKPDSVPIKLELTGAEILEEASTDVQPDIGHVHVALDDEILSLLAGLEFDLAEIAKEPLDPGLHLLEVEFVAADHTPFAPREIETLTFTIRK
jgi:hypothetical protein